MPAVAHRIWSGKITDRGGDGQRPVRFFGENVRGRDDVLHPARPFWRVCIARVGFEEENARHIASEAHKRPAIVAGLLKRRKCAIRWDRNAAAFHGLPLVGFRVCVWQPDKHKIMQAFGVFLWVIVAMFFMGII